MSHPVIITVASNQSSQVTAVEYSEPRYPSAAFDIPNNRVIELSRIRCKVMGGWSGLRLGRDLSSSEMYEGRRMDNSDKKFHVMSMQSNVKNQEKNNGARLSES